jgi:hypothetical protein
MLKGLIKSLKDNYSNPKRIKVFNYSGKFAFND